MSREDTAVLVVDVQEKLLPLIAGHERMVWNIRRLLDAARLFDMTVMATEQYPKGLGPTAAELAERLGEIPEKLTFSCGECGELFAGFGDRGIHKLLLCGIEAHVCVQQTALDLMTAGFHVYLAVDAIAARHAIDYETALRRLDSAGATLTTTEAALFEWCEKSGTAEFKQISKLIQEPGP